MRPLFLLTNDDGINAPGLRASVEVMKAFGDVLVVAPDSPQSGQGHAITLTEPLRMNKVNVFDGVEAYECSGTPADCVKMAKHVLLKNRDVAMCISGPNHGSNASVNIIYSGTMSAAMEASMEKIPSIGFSLLDFSFEADFSATKVFMNQIVNDMLHGKYKGAMLLNVNIPKLPLEEIKGVALCHQAKGRWVEEFIEGVDPHGATYYWLKGKYVLEDKSENCDITKLEAGFVTVVPSMHDLTDHDTLTELRNRK